MSPSGILSLNIRDVNKNIKLAGSLTYERMQIVRVTDQDQPPFLVVLTVLLIFSYAVWYL